MANSAVRITPMSNLKLKLSIIAPKNRRAKPFVMEPALAAHVRKLSSIWQCDLLLSPKGLKLYEMSLVPHKQNAMSKKYCQNLTE